MINIRTVSISGYRDIYLASGGVYFTNIYYGEAPIFLTLNILKGLSQDISSLDLQLGTTFSGGSLIIGTYAPSGVIQTFDFNTRSIIDYHEYPELISGSVEDFS